MVASLPTRAYRSTDEGRLRDDTVAWMEDHRDHEPGWADAYLAVVSQRERRFSVWTYDRAFRTTWRRADGTAIPLALSAMSARSREAEKRSQP